MTGKNYMVNDCELVSDMKQLILELRTYFQNDLQK